MRRPFHEEVVSVRKTAKPRTKPAMGPAKTTGRKVRLPREEK